MHDITIGILIAVAALVARHYFTRNSRRFDALQDVWRTISDKLEIQKARDVHNEYTHTLQEIAEAVWEARAITLKPQSGFSNDRILGLTRSIAKASDTQFLESIGIFSGTKRFNSCYTALRDTYDLLQRMKR